MQDSFSNGVCLRGGTRELSVDYHEVCHGDKRRNNPRFSRFSCIDEESKTEEKRKKSAPHSIFMYSSA